MSRAPAKTISEWVSHAMEDSALEERQKVVKWLRKHPKFSRGGDLHTTMTLDELANAIEVGVHNTFSQSAVTNGAE